jgi:hypothetical protein
MRKRHNHSADLYLREALYAIGGLGAVWASQRIEYIFRVPAADRNILHVE